MPQCNGWTTSRDRRYEQLQNTIDALANKLTDIEMMRPVVYPLTVKALTDCPQEIQAQIIVSMLKKNEALSHVVGSWFAKTGRMHYERQPPNNQLASGGIGG